jgi:hypothetical protein
MLASELGQQLVKASSQQYGGLSFTKNENTADCGP